jgi:hypothetical protein
MVPISSIGSRIKAVKLFHLKIVSAHQTSFYLRPNISKMRAKLRNITAAYGLCRRKRQREKHTYTYHAIFSSIQPTHECGGIAISVTGIKECIRAYMRWLGISKARCLTSVGPESLLPGYGDTADSLIDNEA